MYRHAEAIYCYSSQPRVMPNYGRSICTGQGDEEDCIVNYGNIMYDKRIVRGSTYARKAVTDRGCPDYSSQKMKKGRSERRAVEVSGPVLGEGRLRTPVPVPGRQNKFMQTEVIVKELLLFVNTSDVECQTEPFVKCPAKPFLKTGQTGLDMETQVLPEELFHFDTEVSAPVSVLVEKVVEQSLMEVMEEEELAILWKQQNEFLEKRNAERAEEERLEEAERRRREEKEKQMKMKEEKLKLEKETLDKLACRVFSSSYLSSLMPVVFGCLTKNGYFYDTVERDVEFSFLPWLVSSTDQRLRLDVTARTIVDHLVCKAVHRRLTGTQMGTYSTVSQADKETEEYFEEEDVLETDSTDLMKTKPENLGSEELLTEDEMEENESTIDMEEEH